MTRRVRRIMRARWWFGVVLALCGCPQPETCVRATTPLGSSFAIEQAQSEIDFPIGCEGTLEATAVLTAPDGTRIDVPAGRRGGLIAATITPTQLGMHRLALRISKPVATELALDVLVMRDANIAPILTFPSSVLCRELAVLGGAALCLAAGDARLIIDGGVVEQFEADNVALVDGALWAWSTKHTLRFALTDAGLERRALAYSVERPNYGSTLAFTQAQGTTDHGVVFGGFDAVWTVEPDDAADAGLTLKSLGTFPFENSDLVAGFAMAELGPVWTTNDGPCVRSVDGGARCTSWTYQLTYPDRDGMWLLTSGRELAYARFDNSPAPRSIQIFRPVNPVSGFIDAPAPFFDLVTQAGEYPAMRWNGKLIGLSSEDLTPTAYPMGIEGRMNREIQWSRTANTIEVRRR